MRFGAVYKFYAISLALGVSLPHVRARGKECTYMEVIEAQRSCIVGTLPDDTDYGTMLGEPLMSLICSNAVSYPSCIEVFARGCTNWDEVIRYSNLAMAHCDGTNLQSWLTDSLLETSTLVEPACLSSLGLASMDEYRDCFSAAFGATTGFSTNMTIAAGEELMKKWALALHACARRKITQAFSGDLPSTCVTTTARLVYNKLVTEIPLFPLEKDSLIPSEEPQVVFPGKSGKREQLLYAWLKRASGEY